MPIQGYEALKYQGLSFVIFGKVLIRFLFIVPVVALAALPFLFFDKEYFGASPLGPILILLTNIMIPLFVAAAYLITLYDKIVFETYDLFGWNDF